MKKTSFNISKISIWITTFVISFQLCLWMIAGYFLSKFLAGKKTGESGIIPSMVFTIKNHRLHLHHWVYSSIAMVVLYLVGVSSVFLYGIAAGAVYQGVFNYTDWHRILVRRI